MNSTGRVITQHGYAISYTDYWSNATYFQNDADANVNTIGRRILIQNGTELMFQQCNTIAGHDAAFGHMVVACTINRKVAYSMS